MTAVQLPPDDLVVSVLFEPVPPHPDRNGSHKDANKDYDPGELVSQEVGGLLEQAVLSVDVLGVDGGHAAVGQNDVERPLRHVLEGVGADIEAVEVREEDIELLRKVHVNEHDQRQLLHILNRFVEEVLLALDHHREDGQQEGRHNEEHNQELAGEVLARTVDAVAQLVLVGRVVAVAHPGDGGQTVASVGVAGRALVVVGARAAGAGVVALTGRRDYQQDKQKEEEQRYGI
jgi:hypothetical protein